MQTPTERTGANIRAELARKGMTQAELSQAVNISQSQFSKRLRGVIPFDINELHDIAAHLGVDVAVLLPAKSETAA